MHVSILTGPAVLDQGQLQSNYLDKIEKANGEYWYR